MGQTRGRTGEALEEHKLGALALYGEHRNEGSFAERTAPHLRPVAANRCASGNLRHVRRPVRGMQDSTFELALSHADTPCRDAGCLPQPRFRAETAPPTPIRRGGIQRQSTRLVSLHLRDQRRLSIIPGACPARYWTRT